MRRPKRSQADSRSAVVVVLIAVVVVVIAVVVILVTVVVLVVLVVVAVTSRERLNSIAMSSIVAMQRRKKKTIRFHTAISLCVDLSLCAILRPSHQRSIHKRSHAGQLPMPCRNARSGLNTLLVSSMSF